MVVQLATYLTSYFSYVASYGYSNRNKNVVLQGREIATIVVKVS